MNNNWRDLEAGRELDRLVAENAALRRLLWDARNEVVELCDNFDVPLDRDDWLDLAVKLDEWAEAAGPPPGLADEPKEEVE